MDIHGEDGTARFRVPGKLVGLADTLSLQDLAGNELALIKQQVGLHALRYEITRPGRPACLLSATSALLQRLTVQPADGTVIDVAGDIFGKEYQLNRGGTVIAAISTRWAPDGSYGAEVAEAEDQVLILAVLAAIEMLHRHAGG
jgi:uncharacterized protein YxjI